MVRTDIDKVKEITKVSDVIAILSDMPKGQILDAGSGIYFTCRSIFTNLGALDDFDPTKPEEVVKFLKEFTKEFGDEEIEKILKQPPAEAVEDTKMGPKSLRSDQLKILLDKFDENRNLKDVEKMAREALKDRLLKGVSTKTVVEIYLEKMKLEVAERKKGVADADMVSDKILVLENQLNASGTEKKELVEQVAVGLAEAFDAKNSEERVKAVFKSAMIRDGGVQTAAAEAAKRGLVEREVRNELAESKPESVSQKKVTAVAEEVARVVATAETIARNKEIILDAIEEAKITDEKFQKEIVRVTELETAKRMVQEAVTGTEGLTVVKPEELKTIAEAMVEITGDRKNTMKEGQKKMAVVLKNTTIGKNPDLNDYVLQEVAGEIAETKVAETVTEAAKDFTEKLADLNPTTEQKEQIVAVVKNRAREILKNPPGELGGRSAKTVVKEGKVAVVLEDSLAGKVIKILGNVVPETRIEVMVRAAEVDLNKIFPNTTNEESCFDVSQRRKLKKQIFALIGAESAERMAELSFPKNGASESRAEVMAMRSFEGNKLSSGRNEEFVEQARALKNLLTSPVAVSENVRRILELGNKLDGIKWFDQLKTVAKTLKENPALMRAMEMMQKVVTIQSGVGRVVGGVLDPVGYVLRLPALQNFALGLANRLGLGEMATQLASYAKFGLGDGIKSILGQIFTGGVKTATTVATEGATTVAVDGAAALAGSTIAGIPIAAAILIFQAAMAVGKKILGALKNTADGILKSLNLDMPEVKEWLRSVFGKGADNIMLWGGTAAAFLLGPFIAAALAGSVVIAGWTSMATITGLAYMQATIPQTIAPFAAPKGMGEGNNNTPNAIVTPDPNAPGLTGVPVQGECSVGVVPMKQCDSSWANTQLNGENCSNGGPGTICNSGCGPTSAGMLERLVKGDHTPPVVIFEPDSPYSSMGCNGSSLSQAYTSLINHFDPSKVQMQSGCTPTAIAGWICEKKAVFVLANFYNYSMNLGGHFILAVAVSGGNIISADPYYSTTTPFDGTVATGHIQSILGCLTVDLN